MPEQIPPKTVTNGKSKMKMFEKSRNGSSYKKMPICNRIFGKITEPYLSMFMAELLGTALLMFMGCMGCITQFENPPVFHHMSSITFGMVVMTIIQTLGHISGAHLNPAVTFATVMMGILKPKMSLVYVGGQFIGATLGYGLLKILMPTEYVSAGFCMTVVHEKITKIQALGIEIVITTVLILVCCAVWDKRNVDKADSVPLKFGFIIAAISMAAGPATGASMNTARSLAPLLFGGNWDDQWIYVVGPTMAVPIGCGLYKFFFSLPEEECSEDDNIYLDDIPAKI